MFPREKLGLLVLNKQLQAQFLLLKKGIEVSTWNEKSLPNRLGFVPPLSR